MINRVLLVLALLVVTAGALVFRLPELVTRPGDTRALHEDLALRPMHGDEAIHTDIFNRLWKEHDFEYNPRDFHGPTLHYLTLPVVWMTGAKEYGDTDEFTYRIVPLAFGVALVLLLALVADGLGGWAAIVAGVLTAISPAMVFFSRYYIQEVLLVFFTFGAIASGWRFLRARSVVGKILWAIALGIFVGLMHGTKETWVIAAACAAVAAGLAWLTQGKREKEQGKAEAAERRSDEATKGWGFYAIAAGVTILVAIVVGGVIISAGFKHPKAMLASVMSYKGNVERGAGENPHKNPWDFYLRTLVFWKGSRGVVWSEGLILALAAVGMGAGLRRVRSDAATKRRSDEGDKNVRPTPEASRDPEDWVWRVAQASGSVRTGGSQSSRPVAAAAESQAAASTLTPALSLTAEGVQTPADKNICPTFDPGFLRFLAFYALGMIAVYSAIKYKTPWCELSFLHALILLAGVGAVYIVRRAPMLAIGAGVAMAAIYFSVELIRPGRGEPYLGVAMPKLWIMLTLIGVLGLAALLPRIGVHILATAVLMAWAAQLGSQAYRMNYWPQRLDSEYNPYIYGHPLMKVLDIPRRMEELARVSPNGHHMTVTVVGKGRDWDYWPIPWYLRSFDRVGYWDRVADVEPSWLHADVLMFVLPEDQDIGVTDEMVQGYVSTHFGLRHRLPVAMYVKEKLWQKMLEGRAKR